MKSILVTLLTAFCFVTGYANDSISFCLWNIENFGKSKTDSDIDFIANTISKYKYYNYTGSPLSYSSAQLCRNYNGGGFTDWYMLAIDELNLLYSARYYVNKILSTAGIEIAVSNCYWSSTEYDGFYALILGGFDGSDAYHNDSEKVFGGYFHHFPYFGLRGDEDKQNLISSFEDTKVLYEQEFGEKMLRGEHRDCWHDCEGRCWHACSNEDRIR